MLRSAVWFFLCNILYMRCDQKVLSLKVIFLNSNDDDVFIVEQLKSIGIKRSIWVSANLEKRNENSGAILDSFWSAVLVKHSLVWVHNPPYPPDVTVCDFLFSKRKIHLHSQLQRSKILPKRSIMGMTLNCIWWWDSSSVYLGNGEYSFIAIIPRSTQTQSSSTC